MEIQFLKIKLQPHEHCNLKRSQMPNINPLSSEYKLVNERKKSIGPWEKPFNLRKLIFITKIVKNNLLISSIAKIKQWANEQIKHLYRHINTEEHKIQQWKPVWSVSLEKQVLGRLEPKQASKKFQDRKFNGLECQRKGPKINKIK